MNLRLILVLLPLGLLIGCSTPQNARTTASLDNNGEPVDDGFDQNLETHYRGSVESEKASIAEVAQVIKNFIDAQKKSRQQVSNFPTESSAGAQRIFKDLPKPDYATRDVHRKTNGCFKAELNIAGDLNSRINSQLQKYAVESPNTHPALSVVANADDLGVFASGAKYDAIVRFSNGHPGNRPDRLPDARGMAVKILPQGTLNKQTVSEMQASDLNAATKLDILSINFPTFFVNDPVKYMKLNQVFLDSAVDFKNKLVAKAEELASVFVTSDLNAIERRLALRVNGSVIASPLYQQYFSMVPSRLGNEGDIRAVKYSWEPVACSAAAASAFAAEKKTLWAPWTNDHTYAFPPHTPKEVSALPDDYLRTRVVDRLSEGAFCFNLNIQLYRDQESTNIEDSMDIWPSSAAEKQNWLDNVVPNKLVWNTVLNNTESHSDYVKRISKKLISPRVIAGTLVIRQLAPEDKEAVTGNNKTCEDLSFNPWNGDIAHHKPLGVVSRMKRKVYNASRRERHQLNGINDQDVERH